MRILCIGYYDKFSRFFLGIRKELKNNCQVSSFNIFSLHFSGFLYTFFRLKFSCWLPVKAWLHAIRNKKRFLKIIESEEVYKNIYYKELIQFHLSLNISISKQNLLLQALAYVDIFDKIINSKRPDLILLIGDSRLSIETCIAIAKQKKIKVYFIEQGPFKTTIFNDEGVNANINIDIKNTSNSIKITKRVNQIITNNSLNKPYNRSPFYRASDYFLYSLFEKSNIFPPDLKFTDTVSFFQKGQFKRSVKLNKESTIFLLVLQVPIDVNMIYHSPNFKTHYDIVKAIHINLPTNSQLIIREHPIYIGKYEEKLYHYIKTHNIYLESNTSFTQALKSANVIVVNNSTVGLESIVLKKPLVVLGNAYYNHKEICLAYKKDKDLSTILEQSLRFKPKETTTNLFLNKFIDNYLVEGHITDHNLIAAKAISTKILTDYKKLSNIKNNI